MIRTATPKAGFFARIMAMARRDLTIALSYQFQFVARFAQVFFLLATVFFVSKLVTDPPELAKYGGDYFSFVLVGLIVSSFITVGLGTFTRTITGEQQAGTLELLLSTPTRLGTLLTGAMVMPLGMSMFTITLFIVFGVVFFGASVPFSGLVLSLPLLALTTLVFAAVGLLSASFVVLTKRGDPFSVLVGQASTFFAGAIFPVSVLPGPLEAIAKWVPAYYSLEGIRTLLLAGGGFSDVLDDVVALCGFVLALLPLSILALRWAMRQARITGTLGTY